MHDLLGSLLVWPLESAVNELIIGRDPHVRAAIEPFNGKTIALECQEPKFNLTLQFDSQALKVAALAPASLGIEEDARIEGKLLTLLALLRQDADTRALADPALRLSGNVELIQDLFLTLKRLDIDWSDYLAPVLGDVLVQGAANLHANLQAFFTDAGRRLKRDLDDYLKEEASLIPHQFERQGFQDRLCNLRLQLDRMEARVALIESRLDTLSD